MPQLIALGLVGMLLWYGYRAFKRQMHAVDEEMRKRRDQGDRRKGGKDIDELEKGEDGVYRLKQRDRDDN